MAAALALFHKEGRLCTAYNKEFIEKELGFIVMFALRVWA
jgi:hypothetical protein